MKDSELSTGCPERRTQRRRSNALWRKPAFGWMLPWVLAIPSWAIAFPPLKAETHAVAADEYQVKALFLYNFAKFVDWPTSSFTSPHEPFTFCVVGEDPFGNELNQAVRGKTINGRKLVVRRVSKAQNIRACQIAIINSPDEKSVKRTLDELNAASVLTVGGNNGFTEWGGIVKFTLEGNKIRFEINTDAAEHARLKITSKLLSLAKVVKRGRKG